MIGEYSKGFEVGIVSGRAFERERIVAALKAEDWDAPEIVEPYVGAFVRAFVALIEEKPQA
jgi:hypothetical protein